MLRGISDIDFRRASYHRPKRRPVGGKAGTGYGGFFIAVAHAASRHPETMKITPATEPSPPAGATVSHIFCWTPGPRIGARASDRLHNACRPKAKKRRP